MLLGRGLWLRAACFGLAACGPSYPALYEANARFERCYALDETPQVALPEKAQCWREWRDRYTYGQTRDRLQHAEGRYRALVQVPNAPTDDALMMAAPGSGPPTGAVRIAPAPTNAFAPPPAMAVLDAGTDSGTAPAPPVPQSECTGKCDAGWTGCHDKKDLCERAFKRCMKACFR